MTTLAEEMPYAAAVAIQYLPHTCSKCFKTNTIGFSDIHLSRCVACRVVYYCGKECQQADWKDHKAECRFLKQSKTVPLDDLRLICRMLTKSKKSSKVKAFNGRTYDSLFDATDCRLLPQPMDPSKIFRQSLADDGETMEKLDYMALVEEFREDLTEFMGSEVPDYDTVFKAFSKRTTNAFPILDAEVGGFMQRGVGLYIGLSVHDHSCRPDCFVINQGAKLLLRSFDKDLEYSDKLTICYPSVRSLRTTELRRMILKPYYMFTCNCEECLDLELDEKRSSGRSGCCAKGWFSLDDPVCSECGKEVSEEKYDQALSDVKAVERTTR